MQIFENIEIEGRLRSLSRVHLNYSERILLFPGITLTVEV